jgi:hypothetical protein
MEEGASWKRGAFFMLRALLQWECSIGKSALVID